MTSTPVSIRRKRFGEVLPAASAPARPRFGDADRAPYGAVGVTGPTERDLATSNGPHAARGNEGDDEYDRHEVDVFAPLPLVGHLAHHEVDDAHLWIAVEDGTLIVCDELEHAVMGALESSRSPARAAGDVLVAFGLDPQRAQAVVAGFLGRLAAAGLIRGVQGHHTVKRVRPHAFARFHVTQRCQLECVHCYTDSGPHLPKDGELPLERWVQLVDDFADNGGEKILFTGGEALVYRGCIDVMRRARERGLEVTLFSNGILVPRYIEDLKEVADIVQISVDGPTAASHDAIRGERSFEKAVRAIHALLDAGIQTRVSTTIMLNNWDAIREELPDFIAQFEGTSLSFRLSYGVMPHGRGAALDPSLDTAAVRKFVDGLLNRVRTTEDRDEGPNAVQKISGCGYAEQLVVAPDGLVYPCHLLSGALGHVDDLPLPDITNYLLRTVEAFSVNRRQGCSTCDLRNLCGGSCRVDDEKHTGSRLITTCTPEEKLRKKRFLVSRYRPVP